MFDVKAKSVSWVSFFLLNALFPLLKKRNSSISVTVILTVGSQRVEE